MSDEQVMTTEQVMSDDQARAFWRNLPGIADCRILRATHTTNPHGARGYCRILAVLDGDACYSWCFALSEESAPQRGWDAGGYEDVLDWMSDLSSFLTCLAEWKAEQDAAPNAASIAHQGVMTMSDEQVMSDDQARAFWHNLPGIADCRILCASYTPNPDSVTRTHRILAIHDGEVRYAWDYSSAAGSTPQCGWDILGYEEVLDAVSNLPSFLACLADWKAEQDDTPTTAPPATPTAPAAIPTPDEWRAARRAALDAQVDAMIPAIRRAIMEDHPSENRCAATVDTRPLAAAIKARLDAAGWTTEIIERPASEGGGNYTPPEYRILVRLPIEEY
jgi:hypothetical protein